MDTALHAKILDILDRWPDMTVATVRSDGAPQATVVSFVHDGLRIYFGTGAQAQKAANIAREPRVSITVTAPYADWVHIEGVSLSGIAREVTDAQEKTRVAELMIKRFPQLGLIPVTELKDRLDIKEVPEEDRGRYNTLAGMIMLLLGRLPATTDKVDWDGWRFEVVDLDGKRVDKVLVSRLPNQGEFS